MGTFAKTPALPHALRDIGPSANRALQTPLSRALKEAREEFLRSGERLLDWEGLDKTVAEHRGSQNRPVGEVSN